MRGTKVWGRLGFCGEVDMGLCGENGLPAMHAAVMGEAKEAWKSNTQGRDEVQKGDPAGRNVCSSPKTF
jgi:hypothetical protein